MLTGNIQSNTGNIGARLFRKALADNLFLCDAVFVSFSYQHQNIIIGDAFLFVGEFKKFLITLSSSSGFDFYLPASLICFSMLHGHCAPLVQWSCCLFPHLGD